MHRLTCSGCGVTTTAPRPDGVPRGSFGPRLRAMLSLLAGEFRLAKRPAQRLVRNFLGLDISLGMIAKLERQTAIVLGPVDAELAEAVRSAPATHIDETPWRQANAKAWLWIGTGEQVTHLRISPWRDAATARAILGDDPAKVAICDRYSGYGWVAWKQWCWAHLRRDFQAMIDRADGGSAVGSSLLKWSDRLFWGWHRVADDELSWEDFLRWAGAIQAGVRHDLGLGVSCSSRKTVATCRRLLGGFEHLWRFLAGEGGGADEQPGRAWSASWGAVAEVERRDGERVGQSVRESAAGCGGDVPSAGPRCAGLFDGLLRGEPPVAAGPLAAASPQAHRLRNAVKASLLVDKPRERVRKIQFSFVDGAKSRNFNPVQHPTAMLLFNGFEV